MASPFDVTDLESVTDAISAVEGVDILVNNAGNQGAEGGMGTLSSFHETSAADWHKYFAVNTFGVMNCVHAALPGMISAKWGRIVTIISDASRHGEPSMAAYGAAKAGAAGFMRCIAQEGGRHGITANCISLGTMRTPMTEAMWADPNMADRQKAMMRPYVVRRPGEPEDPAWVVAMLASPRAAWITGQTYPVNGGYTFALVGAAPCRDARVVFAGPTTGWRSSTWRSRRAPASSWRSPPPASAGPTSTSSSTPRNGS